MTEELEKWKRQGEFVWNDRVVQILYYVSNTGVSGNEFEIYFKDGSTLMTDVIKLPRQMRQWHPIHEQAVLLAREEAKKTTTLNPEVIKDLRTVVLDQIRRLKEHPDRDTIAQTKAINESIGALCNIARTEIEYRKLVKNDTGHSLRQRIQGTVSRNDIR